MYEKRAHSAMTGRAKGKRPCEAVDAKRPVLGDLANSKYDREFGTLPATPWNEAKCVFSARLLL
jgi:hypothetical protein